MNGVTTWCRGDGNGHLQCGCCPSVGSKHYWLQSGFRQFANNETIETKQYKQNKTNKQKQKNEELQLLLGPVQLSPLTQQAAAGSANDAGL